MNQQHRQTFCALVLAGVTMFAAAFSPMQPRAAWWCSAFSIVAQESVREPDTQKADERGQIVVRWKIIDWLRGL